MGLGPIGVSVARLAVSRPNLSLVAAIDPDPAKAGQDVGAVLGLGRQLGITIAASAEESLREARPAVVLHCTGSSLAGVAPQILTAVRSGANVVSSCEELAYPYGLQDGLAAELDEAAKAHDVTVLGTGVNPGFAMDALPLMLTAACQRVDRIAIHRVQEAGNRRKPLQLKIGAGLTAKEFGERIAAGTVRHIGLPESTRMVADTLGWELDGIDDSIEPVIARTDVTTAFLTVRAGQVAGVHQVSSGRLKGQEKVRLELEMYVGADDPREEVIVEGDPPLRLVIPGGIPGDPATAAVIVNAVSRVVAAPPGLITMRDLPAPHP